MVFTETDLNKLNDLYNTYYEFTKELDAFWEQSKEKRWHSSRPNSEAFKALTKFKEDANADRFYVVKLLCELANARSQTPVDWEVVETLEEMLMEF